MLFAPIFKCVIFIVAFIYFLSQVYPPLLLFATLRLMLPSLSHNLVLVKKLKNWDVKTKYWSQS